MHYSVISTSANQTKKIARLLAKDLKSGQTICLTGNLGSGKATFVQGLAQGLGIKEKITSPSFVLIKQYKIKSQKSKIKSLIHIDCYRLNSSQEILDLGFEEILSQKKAIIIIEWADKIKKTLPLKRLNIKFEYLSKNKRRIIFSN